LIGYVVMPEHVHLLMGEPRRGTPTTVMQVLKQRVSRALHGRRPRKRGPPGQARLWDPVKRGLARHPKDWLWSSYAFYWRGIANGCPPNPDWTLGSEVGGREKRKTHPSEKRRVRHTLSLFEA
jgi:putative transposase